ncbi:MAG TPA: hypothetical protein DCZ03_10955 [Gammaproteobacteria bacterium]|nr:hypothetical protein [Gammaproteobacteria bacterium]
MSDQLACNQTEPSILAGCAQITDPLHKAVALQAAAAKVNFDWQQPEEVVAKIREELAELNREILAAEHRSRIQEELGDLLFACINLARWLDMNPGQSLSLANEKFYRRFQCMESSLASKGMDLHQCSTQIWAQEWQQAKNECR